MKTKEEILKDQVGSYTFDELIDNEPGVITAMDEYAKQQAIEFLKHGIKEEDIYVSNDETVRICSKDWNDSGFDDAVGKLYDQFIKSQNK